MKKHIFRRLLTFLLACSILISEIPVYAVGDILVEEEIAELEKEIEAVIEDETEETKEVEIIEKIEAVQEEMLLQELSLEEETVFTSIPVPTVALAKDENGEVIGVDITNHLSEEESSEGCGYSICWYSKEETACVWNGMILPETTHRVLFEEMEFECPGVYDSIQVQGFCTEEMSYKGEASEIVSMYFPAMITDELQLELSEELWVGIVKEDGTFRIDAYIANAPEKVEIPIEIDGHLVTEIGENAFLNCKTLTDMLIPEGITSIGNFAFYNCTNLKTVKLPDSILFVGDKAFDVIFENLDSIEISIQKVGNKYYLCDSNGNKLTGYVNCEEKKYYADQNGVLKSGWIKIANTWHYFDESGEFVEREIVDTDGSLYLLDDGSISYFENKTTLVKNSWITYAKARYYFDAYGFAVKGWYQNGAYWYYADELTGKMSNTEKTIGEYNYYFDENYRLSSGWKKINNIYRYFQADQEPEKCYEITMDGTNGWVTLSNEKTAYINGSSGPVKGWKIIGQYKYHFNSAGFLDVGEFQDGKYVYYAETENTEDEPYLMGSVVKGIHKIGDQVYGYHTTNYYRLTGWQTIYNQKYYFNADGVMQTDWFQVGNDWYYADADGIVKKGLVEIPYGEEQEKRIYYFDGNYRLKTGWIALNGTRYYFAGSKNPQDCYSTYSGGVTKGWVSIDGRKSYFNSSLKALTGWQTIGNKKYYFDGNGILQTGWLQINGYDYYADADGIVKKGLVSIPYGMDREEKLYYFDSNYRQKTGWCKIGSSRYFFENAKNAEDRYATNTERVLTPGWIELENGQKSYVNAKGNIVTEWLNIDGKKYYLGSNGILQFGWIRVKGYDYYAKEDGSLVKGFEELPSKDMQEEQTYYFDSNCRKKTGWQTIQKQRYYLNADGELQTGWFTVGKNHYYAEPETTESGTLKGTVAKGVKEIDGETYVFHSKNYYRLTGWQTVNKKKYYLQSDGAARTGWMKIGSYWYYGTEQTAENAFKGMMETGIREIENLESKNNRYYFDSNYRLTTGWKTIGGVRYFFNIEENPQECYMLYSGAIIKNDWYTYLDGTKSYLDNKGNPVKGWKTIDKNKYYFDSKGIMQTGWCSIDGTEYYFDQDGAHVPMNAPSFQSLKSTFYKVVDLSWKSMAGADHYRLEYSTSNAFPSWKTKSIVIKNTSISSYRVEDLESGTTYYFRMRYGTKKTIAGIEFHHNSPYSAIKSIVVCDGVEATSTSAVISACEIISGSREEGIAVRIQATLENRIKSADDQYYIVETESYGNNIDMAQPVGSVDKDFTVDTTVLITGENESVYRALMNKFALAVQKADGSYQLISKPMGITNPEVVAENQAAILRPTSKKGLQGIGYEQALDTNSKNTLFNLDLATVVGTGPAEGYTAYQYKGKTYYFSDCSNLVGEFQALEEGVIQYAQQITGEKNKVCVTLNLLLSYKKANAYLIDPAARTSGYKYYTLNMREEKARETYEALFLYLGELFGQSDCYVTHWVLGNEVNSSRAWNYHGSLSFNTYMQVYAAAFRLLYNGVKATKTGNNVYISLDNGWTAKPDTYAGKTTLDKFAEYAQIENPKMCWGIAYHGYSYPLTKVDFWNDGTNTTFSKSTKYISMKNISVLTDYAASLETKYDKPEGSIRVILSEQGYTASGKNDEMAKKQAEALARGYYMAEFNDRIDAFIIRAINDDTEEMKGKLYLGLKTYTDIKRITFYTYEFMDSDINLFAGRNPGTVASTTKNQEKVKEAQNILGSTNWIDLIPGFNQEKLANMY